MTVTFVWPLATLARLIAGALVLSPVAAFADKISHPTAVFAGLDKITGRIIAFDVAADEMVQFGSLQVTARSCFTRPPTEAPHTLGFVEVDELSATNEVKRIFSGWMFAASPGLHGVEHPIYDVWLTDCKGGTTIIKEEVAAVPEEPRPSARQPLPATRPNVAAPVPPPGQPLPAPAQPLPAGNQLPPRPAPPQPAIVTSPVPPAQPRPAQTITGAPLPPGNIGTTQPPTTQLPGTRSPDIPVPPANIGQSQQQRRAPSQTFFPTETNR